MERGLPWRGPGPGRPDLPLPPGPMPIWRDRSLRKTWRYLGVYGPEFMLCAGRVLLGPFLQTFWAVWVPAEDRLYQRTRLRRRGQRAEVAMEGDRVTIDAAEVRADLRVGDGQPIEVVCPSGRSYAWTRKRADVPVTGRLDTPTAGSRVIAARGVTDESAGYHARHTSWLWSAGVGVAVGGRSVGWNLVAGINDPPRNSERAIWVDGVPSEVEPVRFEGLGAIEFGEQARLEFHGETERARTENLLLIRSRYRQPFGRFAGTLPGIELAEGFGVMEQHEAVW